MASVKKGQLKAARQWWKHLRETKRWFWKSERQAEKVELTHRLVHNADTTFEKQSNSGG